MNSFSNVPLPDESGKNIPWWGWAGALLTLFAILSIWQSSRAQKQLGELRAKRNAQLAALQKLREEMASAARARSIVRDPASLHFKLRAKSFPALDAFYHPELGVLIYGTGIPLPAAGRGFQLWLIPKVKDASPVHSNVFLPDSEGTVNIVIPIGWDVSGQIGGLAISEEPIAGSPHLTAEPIWRDSSKTIHIDRQRRIRIRANRARAR